MLPSNLELLQHILDEIGFILTETQTKTKRLMIQFYQGQLLEV